MGPELRELSQLLASAIGHDIRNSRADRLRAQTSLNEFRIHRFAEQDVGQCDVPHSDQPLCESIRQEVRSIDDDCGSSGQHDLKRRCAGGHDRQISRGNHRLRTADVDQGLGWILAAMPPQCLEGIDLFLSCQGHDETRIGEHQCRRLAIFANAGACALISLFRDPGIIMNIT